MIITIICIIIGIIIIFTSFICAYRAGCNYKIDDDTIRGFYKKVDEGVFQFYDVKRNPKLNLGNYNPAGLNLDPKNTYWRSDKNTYHKCYRGDPNIIEEAEYGITTIKFSENYNKKLDDKIKEIEDEK